jgi:prolyl-tRNA synthetase
MLWSKLYIPTLRETPSAAGGLLLRAGYIRQVAPGICGYLLLGRRSLEKIAGLLRAEMHALGAQEMLWPSSNTNAIAAIARGGLRSHKQLPQIWWRTGLTRHQACSFDLDAAALDITYQKHYDAYARVLSRCRIQYRAVATRTGAHLLVESQTGGDSLVTCGACGYAATRDEAASRPSPPPAPDPPGDLLPEEFHTPDCKTIAAISEFTGLPAASQIKSLIWMAGEQLLLTLLRGDHQLSESKLAAVLDDAALRPATPEEIRAAFGAHAGSLGPVGIAHLTILADHALEGRRNLICGANKDDCHLRNVTPGEDCRAAFHDLRMMEPGDACARCGAPLEIRQALEAGCLSKLGARFAGSLGLHVTNAAGREIAPAMGGYGLHLERLLLAAGEQHHDPDGLKLPLAIAPFTVAVTPVNVADPAQRTAAERIYRACLDSGLDALLDDRDERPGVKFKDADLTGIPYRITVGKQLAEGLVEIAARAGNRTKAPAPAAPAVLQTWIEEDRHGT